MAFLLDLHVMCVMYHDGWNLGINTEVIYRCRRFKQLFWRTNLITTWHSFEEVFWLELLILLRKLHIGDADVLKP